MAAGGGPHLTFQVFCLAVDRLDCDSKVWPGKCLLEVVAGRLQVTAITEQVAAKAGEPVPQWGVGPLQVGADIQFRAVAAVEHRLAKRRSQLAELEARGPQF